MAIVVLSNVKNADDPMAAAKTVLAHRQMDYNLYSDLQKRALEALQYGQPDVYQKLQDMANTMGANIFGLMANGAVNIGGNVSESSAAASKRLQEHYDATTNRARLGQMLFQQGKTEIDTGDPIKAILASQQTGKDFNLMYQVLNQQRQLNTPYNQMTQQALSGTPTWQLYSMANSNPLNPTQSGVKDYYSFILQQQLGHPYGLPMVPNWQI